LNCEEATRDARGYGREEERTEEEEEEDGDRGESVPLCSLPD